MAGIEIPSGFGTSGDLDEELRALIISQSLGFSSHKAQLARLLDTLAPTLTVGGKLVYARKIQLKNNTCSYSSDESEFMKLMVGMDDAGLQEVCDISPDTDDIWFKWIIRKGFDKAEFNTIADVMKLMLSDANVGSIEIYSTTVSYWIDQIGVNPSYITPDASGLLIDRSDYDFEVAGFTYQDNVAEVLYTLQVPAELDPPVSAIWDGGTSNIHMIPLDYSTRVPESFNRTIVGGFDTEVLGGLETTFVDRDDGVTIDEDTIYRHPATYLSGDRRPTIIIRDGSSVDITSSFGNDFRNALSAFLLISGTDFMDSVGGLTKDSEALGDTGNVSYFVTGKQVWDGVIKQDFIDDVDDLFWFEYTQQIDTDPQLREMPYEPIFSNEYLRVYARYCWYFRDNNITTSNVEALTNGIFINDGNNIYLTVDGFKNCSDREYGLWIFTMAYIDPVEPDAEFLGIGGFVGDFLSGLVSAVGQFIGIIVDIFAEIFILTLKVTGTYYILRELGVSEGAIESAAQIVGHIAFAVITAGIASYASLASAGANMAVITTEHIAILAVDSVTAGVISSGVTLTSTIGMSMQAYGAYSKALASSYTNNTTSDYGKPDGSIDDVDSDSVGSLSSDKQDLLELNYNPFARMEFVEIQKYNAFTAFENIDPFSKILN